MPTRYLLYIDILGFSDLVASQTAKVDDLYEVIASLNVHQHEDFRAIIFSDTILVYSIRTPTEDGERRVLVMFLCEFAKDLQHRLSGRQITFRALLTEGEFTHYHLNDVPCFYGDALIRAYNLEKKIPCTGLFIDNACNQYNDIFATEPFGDGLHFVFVSQALQTVERDLGGELPIEPWYLSETDLCWTLTPEIVHVRDIYFGMLSHPLSAVRGKFTCTWEFYRRQYPKTMRALESARFDLASISPSFDWSPMLGRLSESYSWAVERVSGDLED